MKKFIKKCWPSILWICFCCAMSLWMLSQKNENWFMWSMLSGLAFIWPVIVQPLWDRYVVWPRIQKEAQEAFDANLHLWNKYTNGDGAKDSQ